jgi:hypothetical protein
MMSHLSETEDNLPNLPSELITVALADLAKVEASGFYTVDMSRWYEFKRDRDFEDYSEPSHIAGCAVCFGGSVIAGSLGANAQAPVSGLNYLTPEDFHSPTIRAKLWALDCFRQGDIQGGLIALWPAVLAENFGDRKISLSLLFGSPTLDERLPSYSYDPDGWRRGMEKMADELHAGGL